MTPLKAYYYLFYKLYRFGENAPSVWWSDWKANVVITAMEVCLLVSADIYYTVITGRSSDIGPFSPQVLIPLAAILLINWKLFGNERSWRKYVDEFDHWPRRKDRIGGLIVLGVVLMVIANSVFSFYLLSRMPSAYHPS